MLHSSRRRAPIFPFRGQNPQSSGRKVYPLLELACIFLHYLHRGIPVLYPVGTQPVSFHCHLTVGSPQVSLIQSS